MSLRRIPAITLCVCAVATFLLAAATTTPRKATAVRPSSRSTARPPARSTTPPKRTISKPPVAKPVTPTTATGVSSPLTAPVGASAEVREWMESLTLRQQIAQLIIVACYGEAPAAHTREFQEFATQVQAIGVGGMIVNNRVVNGLARNAEPQTMASFLNRMQELAKVPLIVGGDFERGASMRVSNTTKFPHAMAYGAARDYGATKLKGMATAREARALGVHWIFAPDSDVNNNPDNPIINTRSYGEKPEDVARHVRAFIQGAHSDPANIVLVTAKHFPGQGDTSVDTHVGLAKVSANRLRLESVEFVPFRSAIEAGVDAVMSGHLAVSALEPEEIPSTVSKNVLTGILRGQLGFKGLVVTDAMNMQGLTSRFSSAEAAVRSLEAGVDVLLMPSRPDLAVQGIVDALASGRLQRDRVRDSLMKLLSAKARLGLHRERMVKVERIAEYIDSQDFADSARNVAEKAVTLLKNEGGVLPLRDPSSACLLVLAENRLSTYGRVMISDASRRSPALRTFWLDAQMPRAEVMGVAAQTDSCGSIVIAAFVNAAAYRGNVSLLGAFPELVETLSKAAPPVVLVAMGSPYLLRSFPNIKGAVATCSTAVTAELAAVKALWGDIGFQGHLPVTIPGFADLGAGIQLARRAPTVHGVAINE